METSVSGGFLRSTARCAGPPEPRWRGRAAVLLLAVAAAVLCFVLPVLAEAFRGGLGYTLLIPSGWEQIPDEVVEEVTRQVVDPSSPDRPFYDAAFQKAESDRWFAYPYVLVQRIEIERQPTTEEMQGFAAEISGRSASDVEDVFRSDVRGVVSEAMLGRVVLDADRGIAVWSGDAALETGERLRMTSVARFGQRHVILVHSYHIADRFEEETEAFDAIAASFAFDEGLEFRQLAVEAPLSEPPEAATDAGRSIWGRVLGAALAAAVIGVLAGLIPALRRSRRRSADDSGD